MSIMLARHCLFGSDAGKIMNIYLTSLVLGKYQQQEPRTKTVNLQAELVNICHYGEENVYGWVGSTVITHLQYLNLHINSALLGLNIEEAVK